MLTFLGVVDTIKTNEYYNNSKKFNKNKKRRFDGYFAQ